VLRTLLCVSLGCAGAALAASPSAPVNAPLLNLAVSPGPSITVRSKDTAYSLARKYNLTVDALLNLNNLTSPNLSVGQVLLVSPPTYTVVRGDTAYGVARRHNLSVDALLSFNHLSSPTLTVGQILSLSAVSAFGTSSSVATLNDPPSIQLSEPSLSTAPVSAALTSTSKAVASMSVSTITVIPNPLGTVPAAPYDAEVTPTSGADLPLPGSAALSGASSSDWLTNAQSLLGVPYVWGGKSRKGTDCSGFILQVFSPLGLNLPRTSAEQAQIGLPVERLQLQSGDLVFFDIEGRGRVTHIGIALSATTFISANSYAGRVAIDDLGSRYWASRYIGARRVLSVMANANSH